MSSGVGELACSYAVTLLYDDQIPITAEKIAAIVNAANIPCESYWFGLFAKLAEKRNIDDLIMNVGSGGGGAAVAVSAPAGGAPAAGGAAAPPPEEEKKKKEEPQEESDDDMGFSLFD